MIKLNSKIFKAKTLFVAAFSTACNNFGSDYKMENRTPATWVSGLGSKTDKFFSNNISSELDWNKYTQNHGIHIFPDHLLFNSDGAIKIPGFANANYNCKLNSAFFALLAELYIELSNNNSDFLVKFKNFYEEKISCAKKFKYENHMKSWRYGSATEEQGKALLCALEKIKIYNFDEEKKSELLEKVKEVTEEIVDELMIIEKMDSEMKKLKRHSEERNAKNVEYNKLNANFNEKYPSENRDYLENYMYFYEEKLKAMNNPNCETDFEEWEKDLYGYLNFISSITYRAISLLENKKN